MIRVSDIQFTGKEALYVAEAMRQRELSWHGSYVKQFEQSFAQYVGSKYAVAVNNGTAALHLSLIAAGVKPGDEVICPVLSYVATANAILYCGATPVFVDVHPASWCLDLNAMDQAITDRTKAIVPVQLYGHWPDMDLLMHIANRRQIAVVEDAAEGFGGYWKRKHAGTFGITGAFSFYANKNITCGEGGMVVTDSKEVAESVRSLRGQCASVNNPYFHESLGYNYRMTNLQAAVGLGQLESYGYTQQKRQEVVEYYSQKLSGFVHQVSPRSASPSNWMFTVLIPPNYSRDRVARFMRRSGVETRPAFVPLNQMPHLRESKSHSIWHTVMAADIGERGLCLPTHANLSADDMSQVVGVLQAAILEAQ